MNYFIYYGILRFDIFICIMKVPIQVFLFTRWMSLLEQQFVTWESTLYFLDVWWIWTLEFIDTINQLFNINIINRVKGLYTIIYRKWKWKDIIEIIKWRDIIEINTKVKGHWHYNYIYLKFCESVTDVFIWFNWKDSVVYSILKF